MKAILAQKNWLGAGLVVLLWAVTVLAINPIHNFPVEDDWDYTRMVRIFVETGQIQRSDYAQATLIFPTLYGGALSKLFGFSFTNLRLGTLVLALVMLLAFYALLGELEFAVPLRVLGSLALLFTPIFIYLAFSFMTDVPALCWLTLAVLFYVRSFKRHTLRDALVGSVCAALAFLTRQTGAFLPVAFGAIVLLRLPRRDWLRFLAAGVAPCAGVVLLYLALNRNGTTNWATQNITLALTLEQIAQPDWWGIFVRRAVQAWMTIGLYLVPLFAALLFGFKFRAGAWRTTGLNWIGAIVLGILTLLVVVTIGRLAARGEWFPYLTDILTRAGMRPYLGFVTWDAGALRPDLLPIWFYAGLTVVGGILAVLLSAMLVANIQAGDVRRAPAELQFIAVLMVLIALASFLFATFYERYLLPLFVGAIVLLLDTLRRVGFSWRAGAVGLVFVAAVSWFLMQDYWGWNEERWRVGRELLSQNVPAQKIDGGYEWDGWYLYDATVDYIRTTGKPFIYDPWQYVLDPEYVLSFMPMKNYRVENTILFATPFANRQFYLLHRE